MRLLENVKMLKFVKKWKNGKFSPLGPHEPYGSSLPFKVEKVTKSTISEGDIMVVMAE